MNMNHKVLLSGLVASMLAFSGCSSDDSSDDNNNGGGGTPPPVTSGCVTKDGSKYIITGECTEDTVVDHDTRLQGLVKVKNGATLTINPGVTIYGTSESTILVTQGSKIMAEGNATDPIIFTSINAYEGGESAGRRGQWGGLGLMGKAPTNEGDFRWEVYPGDADAACGGTVENDNSGVLSYVEFRWASFAVSQGKETNALSLCGVGSGTTVNNLKILNSNDDGFECWGGSVNIDTVLITNAADDSIDLDSGYRGSISNVTVTHSDLASASFVEASTGGDASTRKTLCKITNATMTAGAGTGMTDDEGGLYLKSAEVEFDFNNTTVNMNASTNTEGAIYAKKASYDTDPKFNNVTLTDTTSRAKVTGDAGGVTQVNGALASGTNNTY